MGYDLTWVEDSREPTRERVLKAVGSALTGEDFETLSHTLYRSLEAVGGYFRASQSMMRSLIAEMEAQGMFVENESMRQKLDSQTGTITPAEIDRAFARSQWPPAPLSPRPEVAVSQLDQEMERTVLEYRLGMSGGTVTLTQFHPLEWARKWIDWLVFMNQARDHQGIDVG